MRSFKNLIYAATLTIALLFAIPMASVFAAAAPSTELSSVSFSGQCLNVYHSIASVGTVVRIYPCDASRSAEHIAVNIDANHKLHIYFKPNLCVGNVKGEAELLTCSNAASNLTETSVNGKGEVRFSSSAGILTAKKPTANDLYPQLTFQAANTKYDGQNWQAVTVQ